MANTCGNCGQWKRAKGDDRGRCLVAGPFDGKDDKRKIALTTAADSCGLWAKRK